MKKQILVIGDLILDEYIHGEIKKISQEAPIPIVDINNEIENKFVLGGAANVAANIKSLGNDVKLIGILGNCFNSKITKSLLKEKKIKYNLLKLNNYHLSHKKRILCNQQQIARLDTDPQNFMYDQKKLNKIINKELNKTKILIISDYNKGTINNLNKILNLAKKKNIKVLLDSKKKKLSEFKNSFLIKPNEKEFNEIFNLDINKKNLNIKIFNLLKKYRINHLLLTLGKNGMKLFSQNKFEEFKPNSKDVFDVTGAGDTVMATIAVCIANNNNLEESVKYSLKAAEIVISKVGTAEVSKNELFKKNQTKFNKICSLDELLNKLTKLRINKKKIVFTNGCFDLLHPGHLKILNESKKKGDILIVGLNSDKSVKNLKGKTRPIINQLDRANILSSLNVVDYVIIFDEKTPLNIIKSIKPDIITKGSDYKNKNIVGSNYIKKRGGKIILIPNYKNYSTSKIIEKK
jgi:D-beta-D-heptose 7-phosphate kinase/D-beta-D-heptose 1-phosphate adenosyltransferase